MIYPATKEIQTVFTEKGFKFEVAEREETSAVVVPFGSDNLNMKIRFYSADDKSDVHMGVAPFVRGNAEKRQALINLCNDFNNRFRFVTFAVDEDSDVCISADLPETLPMSDVGQVAFELLIRVISIAKNAYPDVMKTLWA